MKSLAWIGLIMFVCVKQSSAQAVQQVEAKISSLISKMTLEEKVRMIHANSSFTSAGVPRLGIPELVMSDGPHGVRVEHGRGWNRVENANDSGTYLPVGIALASTWNRALGLEYGKVLGSEAKYRGKNIILGPGINIMRSPLNGRNFEYLSEDPYLISQMVVGYIKGVQSEGVSACVKHFAANNQEVDRNKVDVQMDERTLREIYLPGFKAAVVDAGANSIMGAYNKFRGQYATHNEYLMNTILKGEWKFKGAVISDWGAVHNTMEALLNGTDIEMGTDLAKVPYPNFYMGDTVVALVKHGDVKESVIDDKVRRILRVLFASSAFNKTGSGEYGSEQHIATAKKVAQESIVLLKNENSILPLTSSAKKIAVIGANATRPNAMGGGSSQVKPLYEVTPMQGLKNIAPNVSFRFVQGYTVERNAIATPAMIEEAVEAAKNADVAIVVGGWTHGYDYNKWSDNAYDAEDTDKPNMNMPFGQDALIKAVVKANPNTIVVLVGGGPIDMTEWVDNAKGILSVWYNGMEGGNALAEVLFGKINPSGKLTVTFPKKLADAPAHKLGEFPGKNNVAEYKEGIFVGYRYFDTYKIAPQFAFGHGLSYTNFSYTNLKLTKNAIGEIIASFIITNTGKVAGAEIAQLYIQKQDSKITRADKELKGFEKVFLQPGQSKIISLSLAPHAFQYYDENKKVWAIEKGLYNVLIGSSSANILLNQSVTQ